MDNYDFYQELIDELKIDELDDDILKYRVNSFVKSCLMDIKPGGCNEHDYHDIPIRKLLKDYTSNTVHYHFNITIDKYIDDGNNIVLQGIYNDLRFIYQNLYCKKHLDYDIRPVAFNIYLEKDFNNIKYRIMIQSLTKTRVRILYERTNDELNIDNKLVFYHDIFDFNDILKITNAFVNNPDCIYCLYQKSVQEREYLDKSGKTYGKI